MPGTRSPVLHSTRGVGLHPPLLLLARRPLAPLHRVEDLLGLALGQVLRLRLLRPRLLRAAARRRWAAPTPTLLRRRRRVAALGELEVPLGAHEPGSSSRAWRSRSTASS